MKPKDFKHELHEGDQTVTNDSEHLLLRTRNQGMVLMQLELQDYSIMIILTIKPSKTYVKSRKKLIEIRNEWKNDFDQEEQERQKTTANSSIIYN